MEAKAAGIEATVLQQARSIATLLPALMRQLFTTDDDLSGELSLAQLRVCAVLYERPRPMSALSRQLGVSVSAMTQTADRLERVGMVERVAEGTDRRVRCLQLTARGGQLMRRREEARVRAVAAALESLPPPARAEVLDSLETLVGATVPARQRRVATRVS